MKTYKVFGVGEVEIDEDKTIAELVETAFVLYDYWEPAGLELVTIYDAENFNIVLDRNMTCKEAGLGKLLCIAYFKPNVFFYVEGGWGHHMIQMNAAKYIEDPVSFKLIFDDFNGSPVINGNITLRQIFAFLADAGYIDENCHLFEIYDWAKYHSLKRVLGTVDKLTIDINKGDKGDIPLRELGLTGMVGVIVKTE